MSLTVGVLSLVAFAVAARADDRRPEQSFKETAVPVLAKYCTSCHGGTEPKGELALDSYANDSAAEKDRATWERVKEMIELGEMPPRGKPRPTDAEVEQLTKWIEAALAKTDCTGEKHPGRVTIRRLNRVEYNNTIRDLMGVDFQPADDFPSDDVGYGFDNIGDVLSMSPILVEKYLAAAAQIAERAIVLDAASRIPVKRIEAKDFSGGDRLGSRTVVTNKDAWIEYAFPRAGEYTVRVRAFTALKDEKGGEPPRLVVRLADRELLSVNIKEARDNARTHTIRLDHAPAGTARIVLSDGRGPATSAPGEESARRSLLIVEFVEVRGPVELPASHRQIVTCEPGRERSREECSRTILGEFANRAFRRPATPDEIERLVKITKVVEQQGDGFERGIQLAIQGVLASPHFLFRVESDSNAKDDAGAYPISDYELATRLSYFLWSSMPDGELFDLARRGELRNPEELNRQVRRMLADPKSHALVENFAGQWLQLRDIAKINPDVELFPAFDFQLRTAMQRETELLFEAVMRDDRSVFDFLDAPYTFVNERLARHYQMDHVKGEEFRRVSLEGTPRRGVLTHASILAITSNPTRTSPVKRGKWILENILGAPPPPPPPGVEELDESKEAALQGSLRERMEQHRSKPMCASCHARMDPIGFAFENFDAIGGWRDFDGRFTIDPAGTLPGGTQFDGPTELVELLKTARRQQFCRCISEKMLTYALGRGLEPFDRCAVDKIIESLEQNDYRFSSLVIAITQSDPFLFRGSRGDEK
jgi:mono/diheme cytochrome c family protein